MTIFAILKIFHILTAVVLIGAPLAGAWYLFCMRQQFNLVQLHQADRETFILNIGLIGAFGFLQPISGFALVYLEKNSLSWLWIISAISTYSFTAIAWFALVFFQMQSNQLLQLAITNHESRPTAYNRLVKIRIICGAIAFLALMLSMFIMTSRP